MRASEQTSFWGTSVKTDKGEAAGWRTLVSYLPAGSAAVCPWASEGCRATCLGHHAGRMQMGSVAAAQVRRLARLEALLRQGGLSAAATAYLEDLPNWARWVMPTGQVALRVNGTSDLPGLADAVARQSREDHAGGPGGPILYDYTKSLRAALAWASGDRRVHTTFSLSEDSGADAGRVLAAGGNVAAVVAGEEAAARLAEALGASWLASGDSSDARFLDPDSRGTGQPGGLIWLTPKGRPARLDKTGFVVR